MPKIILLLSLLMKLVCGEKVSYSGYSVYHVKYINDENLQAINELQNDPNYQEWTQDLNAKVVDIMVAPQAKNDFLRRFPNVELFIPDVQQLIDNERPMKRKNAFNRTMNWEDYFSYDEINTWLKDLTVEFPDNVKLLNIGKSYEGRDIIGVHVSYKEENKNKGVLLESGMHAREWIGVASVTYQLNELLRSTDPTIRDIAENHDWYIFPIYNPDGYAFTFSKNRLWRKTRKPYGLCYGADPNRNWGFKWHEGDYNYINPCSDKYAGPQAFSEPEMKQISEYLKTIGSNLIGYIPHHAYSQLLLIPYGDSSEHRDNYDELYSVGLKVVEKIKEVNGSDYRTGNIVEILYKATGNDVDWVKHNLKTRITYVYELRDKGKNGFILPANQIIPTGKETLVGLKTMLNEFKKIDSNL